MKRALVAVALCAVGCGVSDVIVDKPVADPNAGNPESLTVGTAPAVTCEILVVGGGLGGIAAAQEAAAQGKQVCLTEETDWLGGQLSAQGVPIDAVDGYSWSRSFGTYLDRVLADYRSRYPQAPSGWFNPGHCGRPLCFEPAVAARVFESNLPGVQVYKQHKPIKVARTGDTVTGVVFRRADNSTVAFNATITIDSTELGDLLSLGAIAYRVGRDAHSEFLEPHATAAFSNPECLQKFTYVFALEKRPVWENNTIPRPTGYDPLKYGPVGTVIDIEPAGDPGNGWWRWRRYVSPVELGSTAPDITSINMFGANDFAGKPAWCGGSCNIVDKTEAEQAAILQRARDHSLGYLYWMQTDVKRPGDSQTGGYRYLKLRPDMFGTTTTGVGKVPYIREARRLRAVTSIREQDLPAAPGNMGFRFNDTVGTAAYGTDLKGCAVGDDTIEWGPGRSATIPAGALVPEQVNGFLAGGKSLGVSHLGNTVFRIHQNEWNVGQAAGALAATSIDRGRGTSIRALLTNEADLRFLQQRLITGRSGPLTWLNDVAIPNQNGGGDRGYVAMQMMNAAGIFNGYTVHVVPPPPAGEYDRLEFRPEAQLTRAQAALLVSRELQFAPNTQCALRVFEDIPCDHYAFGQIQALALPGIIAGYGCGGEGESCVAPGNRPYFRPGVNVTRAQLAKIVSVGDCTQVPSLCYTQQTPPPGYSDVPADAWFYPFVATGKQHGYFRGADTGTNNQFLAGEPVTRREAAIWMWNHMRLRLALP